MELEVSVRWFVSSAVFLSACAGEALYEIDVDVLVPVEALESVGPGGVWVRMSLSEGGGAGQRLIELSEVPGADLHLQTTLGAFASWACGERQVLVRAEMLAPEDSEEPQVLLTSKHVLLFEESEGCGPLSDEVTLVLDRVRI